jgi:hypothetical protein
LEVQNLQYQINIKEVKNKDKDKNKKIAKIIKNLSLVMLQ